MPSRTIAALESEGYTHAECNCDGCGYTVYKPFDLIIRRGRRSLAAKLGDMTLADLQSHRPLIFCFTAQSGSRPTAASVRRKRRGCSKPTC